MANALILNATFEPLCVVPQRRAIVLVLSQKAVTLEEGADVVRSVRCALPVPSVVQLTRFVRVPHRSAVPLTRRAIFARDGGRCVYCGAPATSIDHVVPRSRGGPHSWDNVVSACRRCNHVKGDRHIGEIGWRIGQIPRQPVGMAWRILGTGRHDPRWMPYLAGYGLDPVTAAAS